MAGNHPGTGPRGEVPDAISINSAGFNLARAVGPALGGLAVAAFASPTIGSGCVFLFNSLSFCAVIYVLYIWKRTPLFKSALPAERVFGSMRVGLRYIRYAPPLQAVLIRAIFFTIPASAVWALLAVVAQQDLHEGAMGYGLLNGCIGLGAVVGASSLPKLRRKVAGDVIAVLASGVFVCTLATLAVVRIAPLVMLSLVAGGFAWTSTTSTFNVTVQLSVPAWVQARALGTYQMVFMGGMALGSVLWGFIAEHSSNTAALLGAAATMLVFIPLARKFPLLRGTPPDMSPHIANRPIPQFEVPPLPEAGPVLVSVEYRILPADHDAFTRAIHAMREVRMRDGAIRWGVFQDAASRNRLVETFVVESWLDYLRQRERLTAADKKIRDRVWSFHQGDAPPQISHMIYARQINSA